MYCKKCGKELKENTKFCPKCGTAYRIPNVTDKRKKRHRITALLTLLSLVLCVCSGIFVFRNEILGLFSGYKDAYYEVDEALQKNIVCEEFRNADLETRKKMAEDTLNNLENSGTILNDSVIFDEETNTFYYNYTDGAEGAVALESFSSEYIGLKYPDSVFYENEDCITAVKSINFETTDYPYEQKDLKALILEGTGFNFAYESALELQETWNQEYLSTDLDNDVTVEELKTKLSGYDFVYILLHGNYQACTGNTPNIILEEKVSSKLDRKYREDFRKDKTIFHLTTDDRMVYAVHPNFFTKYYYESKNAALELKDKIIFIGSCHGYQNRDLVDAFISCGAKAVIGPSDVAKAAYELAVVNDFVYRLLCGDSVEDSLDFAKNIYGDNQWEFADYLTNTGYFSDESVRQKYLNDEIDKKTKFKIANGHKEHFVTLTDDAENSMTDKGYISGYVTDNEQNPASNVNVFASMISHQSLSDISAVTDEKGYYKLECPPGLYRISADGVGYNDYWSNKKIIVTSDTETINDTIVLEKIKKEYTESELKEKVLSESGGNIGSWVYEDFDGNGTKEAYAVITGDRDSITESDYLEDIYYINDNGETTKMPGDFWGGLYYSKAKEYEYIVSVKKVV